MTIARLSWPLIALLVVATVVVGLVGLAVIMRPAQSPSVIVSFDPCDLDRDRVCDSKDRTLFLQSLRQCVGADRYNELADADHDGCVSTQDQRLIFPTDPTISP